MMLFNIGDRVILAREHQAYGWIGISQGSHNCVAEIKGLPETSDGEQIYYITMVEGPDRGNSWTIFHTMLDMEAAPW